MARWIRILVYDGPSEWIEQTKRRGFVQLEKELGTGRRIVSIDATESDVMGGVLPTPPEEAVDVEI